MISIAVLFVFSGLVYFQNRTRRGTTLPIVINGLIPGKPGAESKNDSGTTVLIFFADTDPKDDANKIALGFADEFGVFRTELPVSEAGTDVIVRARHAALKPLEERLTVGDEGLIHTVRMEKDGIYSGSIRGAMPSDLRAHYENALKAAQQLRRQIFREAAKADVMLARVPVTAWMALYIVLIFAFSFDYFFNIDAFKGEFQSYWDALYLSMITITTLGYGDITPIDPPTKILTGVEAVVGVLLIGLLLNSLFNRRD